MARQQQQQRQRQGWLRTRWAAWRSGVLAYLGLTVGLAIAAVGLNWFLTPNKIAAGGVSGLAVVIFHAFNLPVGITMLVFNVPLFIMGAKVLGRAFGTRSVFSFLGFSFFVDVTAPFLQALTPDPLLASIYGGALLGVGLGITYKFGGSTGGTAIAARLIDHYTRIGVGRSLLLADGVVIVAAGLVFGAELALYGLLAVFVTIYVVDLLEEGTPYAKAAFIICDRPEEISAQVFAELRRGVTAVDAKGMYTGESRHFLFVTIYRDEVGRLKQLVHDTDPGAFVVISNVHEALGEGFRRLT